MGGNHRAFALQGGELAAKGAPIRFGASATPGGEGFKQRLVVGDGLVLSRLNGGIAPHKRLVFLTGDTAIGGGAR